MMASMRRRAMPDGVEHIMAAQTEPAGTSLTCASSDLLTEMTRWLSHLRAERRLSPKTLEAYERDVRQFLMFLGEHWGKTITLKRFAALEAADVRSFMAARRAEQI